MNAQSDDCRALALRPGCLAGPRRRACGHGSRCEHAQTAAGRVGKRHGGALAVAGIRVAGTGLDPAALRRSLMCAPIIALLFRPPVLRAAATAQGRAHRSGAAFIAAACADGADGAADGGAATGTAERGAGVRRGAVVSVPAFCESGTYALLAQALHRFARRVRRLVRPGRSDQLQVLAQALFGGAGSRQRVHRHPGAGSGPERARRASRSEAAAMRARLEDQGSEGAPMRKRPGPCGAEARAGWAIGQPGPPRRARPFRA